MKASELFPHSQDRAKIKAILNIFSGKIVNVYDLQRSRVSHLPGEFSESLKGKLSDTIKKGVF